jgi:serine/threonine protein kinase
MALASGTKLGPYEIQSALGAGGMGEVYRARDGRLNRDVAIKVLLAAFARDLDRLRVTHPDGVLWRSRAGGSERRQLTHPPLVASLPKWSPDGQQIAFAGIRIGEPMQIELISAEGGTPREVYPEARNQGSPAWSADGQSLIFGRLPRLEIRQKLPVRLVKFDFRTPTR